MDPNVDTPPTANNPGSPHEVPSSTSTTPQGPLRIHRINPNYFHLRCSHIPTTPLNMFERGRVHLKYYGLLTASVFAGCDRSVEEDEVFMVKEGGKEVWYIHRSVGELPAHVGEDQWSNTKRLRSSTFCRSPLLFTSVLPRDPSKSFPLRRCRDSV